MAPVVWSEAEVLASVGPQDAINAVREAFQDLASGLATNVPRVRARGSNMSLHSLSACSERLGFSAVKVYSATRNTVQAQVLLYENSSGNLLATLAANELGRMRTAAIAVIAAEALLPRDAFDLALIGSGFQAAGVIRSFLRPENKLALRGIRVFSRNENKRVDFLAHLAQEYPGKIVAISSVDHCIQGASLIVTATNSSRPVFDENHSTDAQLIVALGSNALSRQELAPRVVSGARRVLVDSIEVAKLEGGNFLTPIENGKLRWEQMQELGKFLSGQTTPTVNAQGRYDLVASHGLAVQDLYLAAEIFRRQKEKKRTPRNDRA